jgi:hypothetical protein
MENIVFESRPAGYAYLLRKFELTGMPHWHTSIVSTGAHKLNFYNGIVEEIYPLKYWPGENIGDQLEFALKYDGTSLGLLAQIFSKANIEELTDYIKSKPTGKYARRIWFFYEFITGEQLPIANLATGNYVEALETKAYYTIQNGNKSQRHRVINNLLGTKNFCPTFRKTEALTRLMASDLRQRYENIIALYPPELLRRALSYLYNKETKSSFEIEHITLNSTRIEKFIASLTLAEKEDFCDKSRLIELQNMIVDLRFTESDYRQSQNYVGQTVTFHKEIIHYISPKPDDLNDLMAGLLDCHKRMKVGGVSPVIHAAAVAYGFVFLHPFEDGNGRIHRFLIHNILSVQGFAPEGLIFPISAVMLKNPEDYDASLEAFSRPLLQLIDYQLDELGHMTVKNDSALWYRFMDMTAQALALNKFLIKTIEEELVEELSFLTNYDNVKKSIQDIVDLPDRLIDLFIHFCLQNNGKLSVKKRLTYFEFLTDDEVVAMEQAIKISF